MKKIIAIVAVIVTITTCFCIGASATNGITLNDGDTIIFKDTIQRYAENTYFWKLTFVSKNSTFNSITFGTDYAVVYSTKTVQGGGGTNIAVYSGSWNNIVYKTIIINGRQTITDNDFIEWLYNNTESGMPEKPLEKTIDNTKATFATTLTLATAIIAWLMANQIALVGLYMYILIALVATGKRFIKGV